jgi:hypothetical protein
MLRPELLSVAPVLRRQGDIRRDVLRVYLVFSAGWK